MDSGFCLSFLASFSANDEDITDETAGFPALERLDLAESSYAFVMTCFWVFSEPIKSVIIFHLLAIAPGYLTIPLLSI
jgi:hypothetical protein